LVVRGKNNNGKTWTSKKAQSSWGNAQPSGGVCTCRFTNGGPTARPGGLLVTGKKKGARNENGPEGGELLDPGRC